jgi:hypothetical protein
MNAHEIVKALGGRWLGSHGAAKCPAHDDSRPSLSVKDGEVGIVVHCHAGCEQRDVIAALRARGLWQYDPSARLHDAAAAPRKRHWVSAFLVYLEKHDALTGRQREVLDSLVANMKRRARAA